MENVRRIFSNMSMKGRLALGASALAVVLVTFLLVRLATQADYATLMTGIDPAQTSKMTAALDEKGIKYELQNNGTAIAVDKSQTAQARVALAEAGTLGGAGAGDKPGFELFDKQKLGASDFQQKVSYQRALEGEIARTIEQVQGVSGAQVQLVLPEEQLFEDEQSPATAAVLLEGDSASLEPASVRGIAQLVSASVKGLKTSNVSITDGTGALLWPKDGAGEDGFAGGSATPKQAAEARYEQALEGRLNAMLLQTLGPGKGRVQVNADLNTDEATQDQLKYGRRKIPLEEQKEKEKLQGGAGGAGGVSGTEGNVASYAQTGGANGAKYGRNSNNTKYGVDKTVTRRKLAPGKVEKQGVSLLLDESVPPTAVAEVRRAVEAAAGIDPERGDTLAVSQFPFTKPAEKGPSPVGTVLDYAKYALLGLAALAFLLFVARHLRRREQEILPEPTWLREIEAPTPLAALEQTHVMPPEPAEPLPPIVEENTMVQMREQIEDLVNREPQRAAQQVRAWMGED